MRRIHRSPRAELARSLVTGAALPLAMLLLLVGLGRLHPVQLLGGQADLHGAVKGLLLTWQSLVLVRGGRLVVALALAGGLAAWADRAAVRSPHVRRTVAVVGVLVLLAVWRPPGDAAGWVLTAAFLLPWALNVGLAALPPGLLALPGVPLLGPLPVMRAWRDAVPGASGTDLPRSRALLTAVLGAGLSGVGLVGDVRGQFAAYEAELLGPWPTPQDPRVTVLATTPPGVKSDFHDLDLVDDGRGGVRAVVVAEGQRALLAFSHDAVAARAELPPWWGPMEGLVMDAESDGETTWTLDGPNAVVARRFSPPVGAGDTGWQEIGRSAPLPGYVHHAYTQHVAALRTLFLFSIGLAHQGEPGWVMSLPDDTLAPVRTRPLRTATGTPLGGIRDVTWVPPLARFVLSPDMGEGLWTWDPRRGVADPWLAVATRNGRPSWSEGIDRLLLPAPERFSLGMVDPRTLTVRTFPTQPGVRAAAVDARRGLVVTASVLTGTLLVQRLDDAMPVAAVPGLMPMVRVLQLDEARGEAWLTTWTQVVRVRYAEPVGE